MDLCIPCTVGLAFILEYTKHKVVTKDAFTHRAELHTDTDEFSDEQITVLRSCVRDELNSDTSPPNSKYRRNLKDLFRELDGYLNLAEWADKETLPPKATFKQLQPVFDAYMKRSAHRGWCVARKGASSLCGMWLYLGSRYHPPHRTQYGTEPEHWTVEAARMLRGRVIKTKFTVYESEVARQTSFNGVARNLDVTPATEALCKEYDKQEARYLALRMKIGEQFVGSTGKAQVYTSRWSRSNDEDDEQCQLGSKELDLMAGGRATRLVMDDDVSFAEKERDSDLPEEYEAHTVPNALVVRCFSLDHHLGVAVRIECLEPYAYDPKVGDKLILPSTVKTLVHTLLSASLDGSSSVVDVVRNKMGGTTILSHGTPGTGKTLTAEVFSETLMRPLYVVQCSQLGLDVDTIETNLNRVLRRAEKWKAILLLDEADVYVMKRGSDINQNAIVGVFLRVMEYFDGILVLTTNRGECVDDAIRSRCIAEIAYAIPVEKDRPTLWLMLGTHYGLNLGLTEAKALAKKFPDYSGRDIKQLSRLVRVNAATLTGAKLVAAFEEFSLFKPCHVGADA